MLEAGALLVVGCGERLRLGQLRFELVGHGGTLGLELVDPRDRLLALVLELGEPRFGLFAGGGFGLEALGVGSGRLLQLALEAGAVLLVGRGERLRLGQLRFELLDRLLGLGVSSLGLSASGLDRGCPFQLLAERGVLALERLRARLCLLQLGSQIRDHRLGLRAGRLCGARALDEAWYLRPGVVELRQPAGQLVALALEAVQPDPGVSVGELFGLELLTEHRTLGDRGLEVSAELLDDRLGLSAGGMGGACLLEQERKLPAGGVALGEPGGELVGAGGEFTSLVLELGDARLGGGQLFLVALAGALELLGEGRVLLSDRLRTTFGVAELGLELPGAGGGRVSLVLELGDARLGGGQLFLVALARALELLGQGRVLLSDGCGAAFGVAKLGLELRDRFPGSGAGGFGLGEAGREVVRAGDGVLAFLLELGQPGLRRRHVFLVSPARALELLGYGGMLLLDCRGPPLRFHELALKLLEGLLGLEPRGLGDAGPFEQPGESIPGGLGGGEAGGEVVDPRGQMVALLLEPRGAGFGDRALFLVGLAGSVELLDQGVVLLLDRRRTALGLPKLCRELFEGDLGLDPSSVRGAGALEQRGELISGGFGAGEPAGELLSAGGELVAFLLELGDAGLAAAELLGTGLAGAFQLGGERARGCLGLGEAAGELVGARDGVLAFPLEFAQPRLSRRQPFVVASAGALELLGEGGALLLDRRRAALGLLELRPEPCQALGGLGAGGLGLAQAGGEFVRSGGGVLAFLLEFGEPGLRRSEPFLAGGPCAIELLGEGGVLLLDRRGPRRGLVEFGLELLEGLLGLGPRCCGRDTAAFDELGMLPAQFGELGLGLRPHGGCLGQPFGIGTADLVELADRLSALVLDRGDLVACALQLLL